MIDILLQGIEGYFAAYLDDLVVFSCSWQEYLEQLRVVLQHLRRAGLTAKPTKCHLGMDQCIYLRHRVGNGEVHPESAKLQAVSEFPWPQSKKDVWHF